MNKQLYDNLNKVFEKITSNDFLNNRGLGNDIGFYIFDYPAEEELVVRRHIADMIENLTKKSFSITHLNLYHEVLTYLRERNFLEKSYIMQKQKGNAALINALSGPLNPTRLTEYIASKVDACDVIIVTGVGSAWPLVRAHEILNNLQSKVGQIPLIMFYPGEYNQLSLSLFGRISANNYYRAFKLTM